MYFRAVITAALQVQLTIAIGDGSGQQLILLTHLQSELQQVENTQQLQVELWEHWISLIERLNLLQTANSATAGEARILLYMYKTII